MHEAFNIRSIGLLLNEVGSSFLSSLELRIFEAEIAHKCEWENEENTEGWQIKGRFFE